MSFILPWIPDHDLDEPEPEEYYDPDDDADYDRDVKYNR